MTYTGKDIIDFWDGHCSKSEIGLRVRQCMRDNHIPEDWWPPKCWPSTYIKQKDIV